MVENPAAHRYTVKQYKHFWTISPLQYLFLAYIFAPAALGFLFLVS
jgi:hypothetical protein